MVDEGRTQPLSPDQPLRRGHPPRRVGGGRGGDDAMEQWSGGRSRESSEDDQTPDVWSRGIRPVESPRRQRGLSERSTIDGQNGGFVIKSAGEPQSGPTWSSNPGPPG